MAFSNARRLLSGGVSVSTAKLLLMQASISRPRYQKLCTMLLRPFVHQGEIAIRYSCQGRRYTVFIRVADMVSDLFTVRELACDCVYPLPPALAPDLIVDGGGDIGMFSLTASAAFPSAKIVICEPAPRSIAQIQRHLRLNHIAAEILPVCLGGRRRSVPFYLRDAISSSFDPEKPYTGAIDVDVVTMADVLRNRDAQRILIKLDIEGMELEVLENYVRDEERPVVVVGELHGRKLHGNQLREIFAASNWTLDFHDDSENDSIFEAWSPAARQLSTGTYHTSAHSVGC